MGLRDRGFVIDYYIPLFAGVDAAKRDRFRTRFLWDIFAPYYSGGGTGTGGGIGGGDGGFGTPPDFSIHAPTITFPNADENLCLGVCSTLTSDAFVSDNGQTHVASRWIIELMNSEPGGGDPYVCTQYQAGAFGVFGSWSSSRLSALESFIVATNADNVDCGGTSGGLSTCPQFDEPSIVNDTTGAMCRYSDYGRSISIHCSSIDNVPIASRTGLYCTTDTCNVPTTSAGVYVYDSGPDAVHKTSLPLSDIILPANTSFRIMVRYKGSDGGWSDWSLQQTFSLGACEACS